MIYILGIFVISIGLIQMYRLFRNAKRPKIDGKIEKLMDQHIKQDKNKKFRKQPHAKVSFYQNGKLNKADILFKDKIKQVGDTIQLTAPLHNPLDVEMYVFKAEFLMASIITLIGVVILVISHYIALYFNF